MRVPLAYFAKVVPALKRHTARMLVGLCFLAAGTMIAHAGSITLRSAESNGKISPGGETLFGTVADPATVQGLMVRVSTGRLSYVSVDEKTGQFAVRLFAADVPTPRPAAISVEVTPVRELGVDPTEAFSFPIGLSNDPLVNALNRITFGLTPALLRKVNSIGFRIYLEQQLTPGIVADPMPERLKLADKIAPMDKDDWERDSALQEWRITSAAYSEQQLRWVMTLFWENHFWSVPKRQYLIDGQIEEIKAFHANAFGRFEDLLIASMRSPVMMDFLDNASSSKGAITENYARELLELHTVGVAGGYTNRDIRAVADILTGWTVREVDHPAIANTERRLTAFYFDQSLHDYAAKEVPFIGFKSPRVFGSAGYWRGIALARALANAPQTRKFICGKLVAQFISEAKPASALKVCENAWIASKGTMRPILLALLTSPDFYNPANVRSKVKTPFEYVVGAIRHFGLYENPANSWQWDLSEMLGFAGQNLRSYPVPTGFKEQSEKWLSTASMNGRMGRMTRFVSNDWSVKSDYRALVLNAGMRSPEAIAAFLLTLATADRFRLDEFQAVVEALRGSDRMLDPDNPDDLSNSVERAIGLIVTLPSYQLQ